jgi:hypothetical protein
MLGLTSRATPIRRIRIQRGPGSLFTHTSNNAERLVRFQKKSTRDQTKTLKFSNAGFTLIWLIPRRETVIPKARTDGTTRFGQALGLCFGKDSGRLNSVPNKEKDFCSELSSRSAENLHILSSAGFGIFAHPHLTHLPQFCSVLVGIRRPPK